MTQWHNEKFFMFKRLKIYKFKRLRNEKIKGLDFLSFLLYNLELKFRRKK